MSGLEQAFYILGIIFLSLMFLLLIALVVAVFVIKKKINYIHDNIETKLNAVTMVAEKGGALAAAAADTITRKARRTVNKRK